MGDTIDLPTKIGKRNITCVKIPTILFGNRVTIQAHEIKNPKRGVDICDGHHCDQTEAKGDIKFFSMTFDISKIR